MAQYVRKLNWVLPIVLLALGAPVIQAGSISDVIFRIEATNNEGTGYLEFTKDQLVYNPGTNQWTWSTGFHEILNEWGDPIATLDNATIGLIKDPLPDKFYYISLGLAVHAGASDTVFFVQSAQLSFGTLWPPTPAGRATASINATDVNGNGVLMQALGPVGSGIYTAQYNGLAPNGTTFATLVNEVFAGPGGSGSGSQVYPPTGYESIPVPVYDMSAMLAFTLTYGDSGGGTTTYRILPEPVSGVGFLAACIFALGWRRR